MLYQLSYIATHRERGQFIEFVSPVRSETKSLKKGFRLLRSNCLNWKNLTAMFTLHLHLQPQFVLKTRDIPCKLVLYQLWYYYFGCEITSTLRKCLRALLPEIIICFEKWHLRLSFEIFNLVKDPFYSLGVKDLEQVHFISVELPLSLHFNEDS